VRQSNGYVIGFAVAMTVICGGLLALANQGLKDKQQEQITLDTQKQILSAVMQVTETTDVTSIYANQINSYVVDASGNKIDGVVAEKVNTKKEFKKKEVSEKQLPVFEYKNAAGQVEAYIVPMFGKGLWDDVWGYVAMETDLNTIKGASYAHKGETPGLGARITDKEIQARFVGKKIMDGSEVASVSFIKGEAVTPSFTEHEVDGLSGATMTTKGVNVMLADYFGYYNEYFKTLRQ